ncbi:MAG: hypothetical protein EOP11_08300 [Proteobacteria bacterium]|nr:MAG: hypothetical protein EOP11_08300 [Pseudomonadota bacterium]
MQSRILGPRCARCHGGDVMASYESVVSSLPEITRRIQLPQGSPGAMPPGGASLSASDIGALLAWSAAGALREPSRVVDPAPMPMPLPRPSPEGPPRPAPFSFAEVKETVFTPRCARCHSGMVKTYANVIENLTAIELKISSGQMPPARAAGLTEEEKQLVLRWIAMGAPEGGLENSADRNQADSF